MIHAVLVAREASFVLLWGAAVGVAGLFLTR